MNAAGRLWIVRSMRNRWRAVVVLVVLTALAGGVALTAITGAHRSAVVVDETLNERRHPHAMILANLPGFDWTPIVEQPYVESYGLMAATVLCVSETGGLAKWGESLCDQPPAGGGWYDTIDRFDVLDGRRPTGPNEIAINRKAQRKFGWRIGQRLQVEGIRPGRLESFWAGEKKGTKPWGPTFAVTVTGVIEGADDPWRVLSGGAGYPGYISSRAFIETHGDEIEYREQVWLRLKRGEADIPQLQADAARIAGTDAVLPIRNVAEAQRRIERSTRMEAIALALFALALLAAGGVLVGQAVARLIRGATGEAATLRSLGMAPRPLVTALAAPGVVIAVVGALGAVGVAIALSPIVPIGTARTFERDEHAVKVDELVLGLGAAGIALLLVAGSVATAFFVVRKLHRRTAPRRTRGVGSIVRVPLPPTMALGVRMALERRPGGDGVPVRPALIGAVVGVLGVVAALTVHAGITQTIARPALGGQTWDAAYYSEGLPDQTVVQEKDILAGSEVTKGVIGLGGLPIPGYGIRPIGGGLDSVVLAGRRPRTTSEVVLGPSTADALGVEVGDLLSGGRDADRPLRVVGEALLFEEAGHAAYDEGAWLTVPGLERLEPEPVWQLVFIDIRPGADAAVHERLAALGATREPLWPGKIVAAIDNLDSASRLPGLLGGFLALLGVGALGHTLISTVRRRRKDLAVLRVLGLSRRGTRAVVAWQATTVGAIALVLGIPLGIAIGRLTWYAIATSMPIVHVTPPVSLAVLAVIPAALMLVNLAALWPAWAGGRAAPAVALRAP